MENLIYKYLTINYYLDVSEIGNYGIYNKNNFNRNKIPYNGDKLINDLIEVFGIDKDNAFSIIMNWVDTFEEIVDLTFYWKDLKSDFVLTKYHG